MPLRASRRSFRKPIVLNGLIGPRGDAYAPDETVVAAEAERYHHRQLECSPRLTSTWSPP